MLSTNPAYKQIHTEGKYCLYIPVNTAEYHTSRYVEAMKHNTYANCGITEQDLNTLMDEIIERCNKTQEAKTLKTDIAAIANLVKYRTAYPVDNHCALRVGYTLAFIEYEHEGQIVTEDPDKIDGFFVQLKERLAFELPGMYTFFLTWGIANTPKYNQALDTLNDPDYFVNRMNKMKAILPENLWHILKPHSN